MPGDVGLNGAAGIPGIMGKFITLINKNVRI
jgi:hypothetical protein